MKILFSLAVMLALVVPQSQAQTRSTTAQELIKLENAWSQAAVNRDGAALRQFYAEEYTFTDADGAVTTKNEELKNITGGAFKLADFKFENMEVRVYGNVAVVTGRNTIHGVWEDIVRDVSGPYRFTDVFVKRAGRWLCVASQSSRVIERVMP
jgi:ketosteroid isomerase-like protein